MSPVCDCEKCFSLAMRCIISVNLRHTAMGRQTDGETDRENGRLGDRPRTDCQVHPTVCQLLASAASAHIYQHYLTNYKRNLIYPVIFYVRKHSRQPWKVVFDCSTHTSLHKYLHKYFVFHTFHMQTLASSPWQRMQLYAATRIHNWSKREREGSHHHVQRKDYTRKEDKDYRRQRAQFVFSFNEGHSENN